MQRQTTEWTYLRTLRRRARLSPAELAAKVRYSRTHIGEVERGVASASEELVGRLADAFGVDVMELYRTRPATPPRTGAPRRRRASATNTSETAEVA